MRNCHWQLAVGVLIWAMAAAASVPAGPPAAAEQLLGDPMLRSERFRISAPDAAHFPACRVDLVVPGQQWKPGRLVLDPGLVRLRSFEAPVPLLVPATYHGPDEAEGAALAFAGRRWSAWRDSISRLSTSPARAQRPKGQWRVEVAAWHGEMALPLRAQVVVNAWDLTLGGFVVEAEEPVTADLSVGVGVEEAAARALAEAKTDGWRVRDTAPVTHCLVTHEGREYYAYGVKFMGDHERGGREEPAEVCILVDAHSGRTLATSAIPTGTKITFDPPPRAVEPLPEWLGPPVRDAYPCWASIGGHDAIVFTSNRSRYGAPRYIERGETAVVARLDGVDLACLRQSATVPLGEIQVAGDRLAFSSLGARVLDLATGTEVLACTLERPGRWPALSPGAGRLAVVADRARGLSEVYVGDLDQVQFVHQRRPVEIQKAQCRPVFGGNENELFFFTTDTQMRRFDLWRTTVPDRMGEGRAESLAADIGRPEQVTVTRDGALMLLWDGQSSTLIDTRNAARRRLALPPLSDPDVPGQTLGDIAWPAISPDGSRLVFAAPSGALDPVYRDRRSGREWRRRVGMRIYVCNLDGSGLKRITPLEDVVAPPYVFPATGKPAFEVPEEYAKPNVMP